MSQADGTVPFFMTFSGFLWYIWLVLCSVLVLTTNYLQFTLGLKLLRPQGDLLDSHRPEQLVRPGRLPRQFDFDVVLSGPVFPLSELLQVNLVGAVRDPERPQVCPHVGQGCVLTDPHGAVSLDGPVDDLEGHLGDLDFGLGDLLEGELGVPLVGLDGRVEDDQTTGVDLDPGLGHPLQQDTVFGQAFPERDLSFVVESIDQPLQSLFRRTDASHGVVDTTRAQTALHDFVPPTFTQDHGVEWDTDVGEGDVAVAVGGVVVAVHAQHAVDLDPGSVGGDQHHRLALVLVGVVRVGLTHGDEDLAAVVPRARGPPLAAVEEVVVALSFHPELDVGPVGGGNVRFGHQEGRPDLAGHQRFEPLFLLCRVAVPRDDFHVAGVRGRTVTRL